MPNRRAPLGGPVLWLDCTFVSNLLHNQPLQSVQNLLHNKPVSFLKQSSPHPTVSETSPSVSAELWPTAAPCCCLHSCLLLAQQTIEWRGARATGCSGKRRMGNCKPSVFARLVRQAPSNRHSCVQSAHGSSSKLFPNGCHKCYYCFPTINCQ